jgi:Organic Anion Transporter Polypeptide (OATP) family
MVIFWHCQQNDAFNMLTTLEQITVLSIALLFISIGSNASSAPSMSTQFCPASSFDKAGNSDDYNMCNATYSSDINRNLSSAADGYVHPAYYMFATAQFIGGVGTAGMGALGFSYIDENSPKTKTSLYMGNPVILFYSGLKIKVEAR